MTERLLAWEHPIPYVLTAKAIEALRTQPQPARPNECKPKSN